MNDAIGIEARVRTLLKELEGGNAFGEPVTLVAATKTRTQDEIARAIAAGITDVGENRAQELRDKYDVLSLARVHFIGRLQTNKLKYVVGKTALIHSVDSDELAAAISRMADRMGCVQDVLLEVNIGGESAKGGYAPARVLDAWAAAGKLKGIHVRGLMTVLPQSDEETLARLADRMRALFDVMRREDERVTFLSMGMSEDHSLCLAHGSNMIRLGTAIFGPRTYAQKN